MAGVKGLEPSAFAVTGRRCNQLNYTPALRKCALDREVSSQPHFCLVTFRIR